MNREEAATIYRYSLPGFCGDFLEYRQAADTLTDVDWGLLHHAVSGCLRQESSRDESPAFLLSIK